VEAAVEKNRTVSVVVEPEVELEDLLQEEFL
jgi:hypothetical protein